MGHVSKKTIDEKDLSNGKLLDDFRRLASGRASRTEPAKRPGSPERLLLEQNYFILMLFGLLNPLLDNMRGLCAAKPPPTRPRRDQR